MNLAVSLILIPISHPPDSLCCHFSIETASFPLSFPLVSFPSHFIVFSMNLTAKAQTIERDFQNARAKANYAAFPEFARRYVKHNKDGIGKKQFRTI